MCSKFLLCVLALIIYSCTCAAIDNKKPEEPRVAYTLAEPAYSDSESGDSEEPSDLESGSGEQESGSGSGSEPAYSDLESGDSEEPSDLESGSGEQESGSGSGSEPAYSDLESGDSEEPSDLESGSGEQESGSGSGSGAIDKQEESKTKHRHPLGWVKHSRNGNTVFVDALNVRELFKLISSQSSSDDCFSSQGTDITSDGPIYSINQAKRRKQSSYVTEYDEPNTPRQVINVSDYPEYAIGRLDNGCTAFLVGPYHALTLAHCVFNRFWRQKWKRYNGGRIPVYRQRTDEVYLNQGWKETIDFLRGRNEQQYLQRMEWEEVYIPQTYFSQSEIDDWSRSWAVIVFNEAHSSPVWIPFSFCSEKLASAVTAYGYFNRLQRSWRSDSTRMDFVDCTVGSVLSCGLQGLYDGYGGPLVINGRSIDNTKMAPVVGINGRRNSYSRDPAIFINPEMFWSICSLLSRNGYEPGCGKWKN
ncbi:uncharacterized protein LOC135336756 [Halichondria panicea]|uniref:uncharacterized protein LOC135336756 n=1 Tax=Halichondria panicea TaxID=6063 RepID=UPI00312B5CFF